MLIQGADPQLWEAICLLTRSVSERVGITGLKRGRDPTSVANQTKKLRRFLLSAILFCSDDRCSVPLHTLLTDMIDSQGGSALLVRILVCASLDTLSRSIQHHVGQIKGKCGDTCLNTSSFTVVSADNIGFQHSYARVFCGNQASSWHGTSIQATHPLPSLGLLETYTMLQEFARMEVGITGKQMSRKRTERESLLPSPSKSARSPAQKLRRMRTGTERSRQTQRVDSPRLAPKHLSFTAPIRVRVTRPGPPAFPPPTGQEVNRLAPCVPSPRWPGGEQAWPPYVPSPRWPRGEPAGPPALPPPAGQEVNRPGPPVFPPPAGQEVNLPGPLRSLPYWPGGEPARLTGVPSPY